MVLSIIALNFFYQFFTIHVVQNGRYIPLVFSLLPNKTAVTYEKLFTKILSACDDIDIKFQPTFIVADFEITIHKAANQVWPSALVIRCRFHLSQAWWRNIQALGLSTDYKGNTTEIGK